MSHNKMKSSGLEARDPPRSLFAQLSPSASHVSLSGAAATVGLPSSSGPMLNSQVSSGTAAQKSQALPPLSRTSSMINPHIRQLSRLHTGDSARTVDRTDALWAEMQATLEEAELSASGGTRVFGPDHDRKLAELRVAQIALAQAWGRSAADDAVTGGSIPPETEVRNLRGTLGDIGDASKSTVGTGSAHPGNSSLDGDKLCAKLEEETERDILLARNRREANDRYFSKVDQGVRDVVAKLEEVAIAMRAVEQETRGIWGGEEATPESADFQSPRLKTETHGNATSR
ncbi:hypothetical protein GGS21DRAFT_522924 [Xylaria nigripes]|nr:hypothetical protein GGS21DRAFT_522924 [Xylaria nigripes]